MSTVEILLAAGVILSLSICAFLFVKTSKTQQHYRQLTQGVQPGNLEQLLDKHLARIEALATNVSSIEKLIEEITDQSKKYFQYIGFKRYNPFHETGGDQSFVIVLLNEHKSGLLLSSLHQRDVTRVYAKQVTDGISAQKLSDEEQKVLTDTLQGNGSTN